MRVLHVCVCALSDIIMIMIIIHVSCIAHITFFLSPYALGHLKHLIKRKGRVRLRHKSNSKEWTNEFH